MKRSLPITIILLATCTVFADVRVTMDQVVLDTEGTRLDDSDIEEDFDIYFEKPLDEDPITDQWAIGFDGFESNYNPNSIFKLDIIINTVDRYKMSITVVKEQAVKFQRLSVHYLVSSLSGLYVIPFDFDDCPTQMAALQAASSTTQVCSFGNTIPGGVTERGFIFTSSMEYKNHINIDYEILHSIIMDKHTVEFDKKNNGLVNMLKGFIITSEESLAVSLLWIVETSTENDLFVSSSVNNDFETLYQPIAPTLTRSPMIVFDIQEFFGENCENNFYAYILESYTNSGDLEIGARYRRVHTACDVDDISLHILILCHDINACTDPVTQKPQIQTGSRKFYYAGYDYYYGTETDFIHAYYSFPFDVFFDNAPQYNGASFSFINMDSTQGQFFSLTFENCTKYKATYYFRFDKDNAVLKDLEIHYITSDVDWFQIHELSYQTDFDDFVTDINCGSASCTADGTISFTANTLIGSNPKALFFVTGIDFSATDPEIDIYFEQTQAGVDEVAFRAVTTTDQYISKIYGFVIITYDDRTESLIETYDLDVGTSVIEEDITILPNYRYNTPLVFYGFGGFRINKAVSKVALEQHTPTKLAGPGQWQLNFGYTHPNANLGYKLSIVTLCGEFNYWDCFALVESADYSVERQIIAYGLAEWTHLALFVTQKSQFGDYFQFESPDLDTPYILHSEVGVLDQYHSRLITIPAIRLPNSMDITYLLFQATPSLTNFYIVGFEYDYYDNFLEVTDIPIVQSGVGPIQYPGTVLINNRNDYFSVLFHKVFSNDQAIAMSCKVQITFSGFIQGLYANDKFLFADSSIYEEEDKTVLINERIYLRPKQSILFTIFGYFASITSLNIQDCIEGTNGLVVSPAPVFEGYTFEQLFKLYHIYHPSNSISCSDPFCSQCLDEDVCALCTIVNLFDHECISRCDADEDFYFRNSLSICENQVNSLGLAEYPPIHYADSNEFEISYFIARTHKNPSYNYNLLVFHSRIPVQREAPFPFYDDSTEKVLLSNSYHLLSANWDPDMPLTVLYETIELEFMINPIEPTLYIEVYRMLQGYVLQITQDDNVDPIHWEFLKSNSNFLTLDPSKKYVFYIFVKCLAINCEISFDVDGTVNVKDDETVVITEDFGQSFGNVMIADPILPQNSNKLFKIEVSNTSEIDFIFSNLEFYGIPGYLAFQDIFTITNTQDVTVTNDNSCPEIQVGDIIEFSPVIIENFPLVSPPYVINYEFLPALADPSAATIEGNNLILDTRLLNEGDIEILLDVELPQEGYYIEKITIWQAEQVDFSMQVTPKLTADENTTFTFTCLGDIDNSNQDYQYSFSATNQTSSEVFSFEEDGISTGIVSLMPRSKGFGEGELDICCSLVRLCRSQEVGSACTTITISNPPKNSSEQIDDSINEVDDLLYDFEDKTPEEQLEIVGEAANTISELEETLSNSTNQDPCTISGSNPSECAGNGECNSHGDCVCEEGWTLSDCSVAQEYFDKIIGQKKEVLSKLNETLDSLGIEDPEQRADIVDQLDKMSDPNFSSKDTSSLVKDVVDKVLQVDGEGNSNLNLTEKEVEQVTNTISNLLLSSATYSCSNTTDTELKDDMGGDIESYLSVIGDSALKNSKSGANTTVATDAFDLFTAAVSKCNISSEDGIRASEDSPKIFLDLKEDDPDCSELVNIKYYAFQEDLFSCNKSKNSSKSKDRVVLEVENENGTNLNDLFSLGIKYNDDDQACESGCSKDSKGVCQCEDLALFDVGSQMSRLFTNSKIGDLGNIEAFKNWKFYEDWIFYVVTGITIMYLLQLLLVNSVLKDYCMMQKLKEQKQRSCCETISASFALANEYVNAFIFKDIIYTKSLRATIYYMRVMLMLTFSALFKSSDGLNSDEGFRIDPYIIALPILTVYPIKMLLGLLIKPTTNERKNFKKKKSKFSAKRAIGLFLTFTVCGGCIYCIFLVAATNTESEALKWTFDFALIMAQDWVVFPLLIILFQRGLSRYAKRAQKQDQSFQGFVKRNVLNENQEYLFASNPTITKGGKIIGSMGAGTVTSLPHSKKSLKPKKLKTRRKTSSHSQLKSKMKSKRSKSTTNLLQHNHENNNTLQVPENKMLSGGSTNHKPSFDILDSTPHKLSYDAYQPYFSQNVGQIKRGDKKKSTAITEQNNCLQLEQPAKSLDNLLNVPKIEGRDKRKRMTKFWDGVDEGAYYDSKK